MPKKIALALSYCEIFSFLTGLIFILTILFYKLLPLTQPKVVRTRINSVKNKNISQYTVYLI